MTGYADPSYARSLAHIGSPVALPRSGGFLLRRAIDGRSADAFGTYPFLACDDWSALADDLASLPGDLVSVVAVPDPLGTHSPEDLRAAFPDYLVPYKTHYLVDLRSAGRMPDSHHRRNVRLARERVDVVRVDDPPSAIESWSRLYGKLIERHRIEGPAAFPEQSLARQLDIPGLTMFAARNEGRDVGMALFFAQGDDVYYHLAAYDEAGYTAKASYALFDSAIAWFRGEGFRRLLLGSGAGAQCDGTDGLSRFKRGWATDETTGFIGGRVLDSVTYQRLSTGRSRDYFPAYRVSPSPAPGSAAGLHG